MARGLNHVVQGTHPVKAVKELNTQTDEQKIIAYVHSPDPNAKLSAKLKKQLKRYEIARDKLHQLRSINKTAQALAKLKFDGEEISERTARRYIAMAQKIYGAGISHDRKLNLDWLIEDIKQDVDLARALRDTKSIPALRKLMLEIIDKHMGDAAADLYKDLQPHKFILGFFPEDLKTPLPDDDELQREIALLKQGKLSDSLDTQTIPFQDIDGSKESTS